MLNTETTATIAKWASLFADEVQGKMGYTKSAPFIGHLISTDQFAGRQTLTNTLRQRGYGPAEFAEALAIAITAISNKPGWSG